MYKYDCSLSNINLISFAANKETAKKYYEKGVVELINGIQVDLSGAIPEERVKALEYQERMKKLLQNTQSRLDDLKSGFILFRYENISR